MPNHVQNEVTISCPTAERLSEILNAIKSDKKEDTDAVEAIDFNKVIPMPNEIRETEASSNNDKYFRAFCDYVAVCNFPSPRRDFDPLAENEKEERVFLSVRTDVTPEDLSKGKRAYRNKEKYGETDWYNWAIRFWGTKWNAYDAAPTEFVTDKTAVLRFATAWSAPRPIIDKIASMFTDAQITHRWADEDVGYNCGEVFYHESCAEESIPQEGEKEAFDLSFSVWDTPPDEWGLSLSDDGSRYISQDDAS